jgi:hypothetical protein
MRAQQQGGSAGAAEDKIDALEPPEPDEGAGPVAPVTTP